MIPIATAESVAGTAEKIDVLYIGYLDYANIPVHELKEMYYQDDFSIHTYDVGDTSLTFESDFNYDLSSFDIVILDMGYYSIPADLWADFEAANKAGTTLVAIMNDYDGATLTPEYFDFRDTAELTTSKTYTTDQIKVFFDMYEDMYEYMSINADKEKELKAVYAENILMYLASLRSANDAITST